ncbi:MAG: S46 family peptidase [Bacteroidota bacterium]
MNRTFLVALVAALFWAGCGTTAPAASSPDEMAEEAANTVEASAEAAAEAPQAAVEEMAATMDDMAASMADAPLSFDPDTVQAGAFDNGKMFTLDNPPLDYFREAYDFAPDDAWFEKARLGAVRFPNCSGSFVSPHGLMLTNHHCARASITEASRDGEDLPFLGFHATSLDEERPVDYAAEQLIEIIDVTDEVQAAAEAAEGDQARSAARDEAIGAIETRMAEERGGEDAGIRAQVITLYAGGQFKAYIFKRYDDVRLVFAPEDRLGKFGGDPDNFTYPRYSLDFALFRAYDDDGAPLETPTYFQWSENGSAEGDLVFVIGNPGSTSRLQTVSELLFRRDHTEPAILRLLATREVALKAFVDANPDDPATPELRDSYLSAANGRKAYTGRLEGLQDPYIIARRRAAENDFKAAIMENPALAEEYIGLFDDIAANREAAKAGAPLFGALLAITSPTYGSQTMRRALLTFFYASQKAGGVPEENLAGLKNNILSEDIPTDLDRMMVEARLNDLVFYLGEDDDLTQLALGGMTPADRAAMLVENSAFADSSATAELLASDDILGADDPALTIIQGLAPQFGMMQQMQSQSGAQLEELSSRLARARFEVYGESIPPDATFSLRISDGVVKGYEYNGTIAPAYTTMFGLYDHFHSYCDADGTAKDDLFTAIDGAAACDWDLPDVWLDPPAGFDYNTPMNFVSTNDIIGGNSGSPVLSRDLEIVGVAFDGNISSLPGDYIFDDTFNRTVSVDSRGMMESMRDIYQAERLVDELMNGTAPE